MFLSLLAFASCAKTSEMELPEEKGNNTVAQQAAESCLVPGTVTVKLTEELAAQVEQYGFASTKSDVLSSALNDIGFVSAERVFPEAGEFEQRHRDAGLHLYYRLKFDESRAVSTKAAVQLSDIEGIMEVEPVRKIKTTAVFNDPYLGSQWHYINPGTGSTYKAGADINVKQVWERYTTGSPEVIVAVSDQGVDLSHEDLAAHCLKGGMNGSKCFLYDFPGYTIYPGNHGTHVAGTISAINNNGIGVCGIAGGDGSDNTGVKIMSCQILRTDPNDSNHTYQGDSDDAFVWAADHGAVISQNSWGYVYDTAAEAARGGISSSTKSAIDYFIKNAGTDKNGNQTGPMKGGVVLFAAGNDAWPDGWPGKYDGNGKLLAVGAISSKGTRTYYSNYGDWVDICAPGGDYKVGPEVLSCITDNGYGNMQGTSMACPHVSGVAALIVSYFGGPGFTNDMLVERLLGGTNKTLVSTASKIGNLVDAYGSFVYGDTSAPDKVESFSSAVVSNTVDVTLAITADGDQTALGYMVCASKTKSDLESLNPRSIPSSVKTASNEVEAGAKVGDTMVASIKDLDFSTTYYISVYAFDYSRNFSESSPIVSVKTEANHAPVITTSYTGDFKVHTFETLMAEFSITEPDGHDFSYEYVVGSDADFMKVIGGVPTVYIKGSGAPVGKYHSSLTATDKYGMKSVYDINFEILENQKPFVVKQIENIQFSAAKQSINIDMNDYIQDPDGEPLTYDIGMTTKNVVHCFPTNNMMNISSLGFGLTDVVITAIDAAGEKCSLQFKALVRDNSTPADVYPNPATSYIYVRPGEPGTTTVKIFNQAGSKVYEKTAELSAFDPLKVDVSGFPGGVYTVVIKSDKIDVKYNIAKL